MILWPILGILAVLSILFLLGVWVHERLPRWRAADAAARREPLTAEQHGERFFTPEQAPIAAHLRSVVAEQTGKDLSRLHPDDRLAAMVFYDSFDSLDTVEAIMAVEEEFGIELDGDVLARIETFRDLVDAVAARKPFLVEWRQQMGRTIEQRFGVSLNREALAQLATPDEVTDAVAAELKDQVGAGPSCQSQRVFYLLRNAIMRTLRVPRSVVKPATPLRAIIRWRATPSVWAQLRDAVAAHYWPPLVRPRWMSWLVFILPLLLGTAIGLGLPWLSNRAFFYRCNFGFWVGLAAELWAWIAIPAVIGSWILLVRVSKRFQRSFPRNIRTVGDLVPFVTTSGEATWTREEIEQKVRDIVVEQLRIPAERYQAGARFVQELGLEPGWEKR